MRTFRVLFPLLLAFLWPGSGCEEILSPVDTTIKDRPMYVYLPPGYGSSTKSYPVVYLFDGEQWALTSSLNDLILKKQIPEVIVVEVFSTDQRTSEFLPYDDPYVTDKYGRYVPNAEAFADYIIGTVVPRVDSSYRTIRDRDNRAVMGASFGGLFATWLAYHYDETFSMAGAFSPSYWVADGKLFDEIAAMPNKDVKLWYDLGTAEWNYYIPLLDVLAEKGLVYGKEFAYYEVKGGQHFVLDWMQRVPYAMILYKAAPSDSIVAYRTDLEVIPSVSMPGTYFQRLNPVITLSNGLVHSAVQFAGYQLLNPDDGVVNRDGSFDFKSTKDLRVRITYHTITDTVTVGYDQVQRMK